MGGGTDRQTHTRTDRQTHTHINTMTGPGLRAGQNENRLKGSHIFGIS